MYKNIIIGLIVAISTTWISTFAIDYFRAMNQNDPLFTFRTVLVGDGGTTIEYGAGYRVIHYRQMEEYGGRKDIVFKFGWDGLP